ncbi:hypothetical protein KZ829_04930 [Actinoplanes hulinensis]|uniref:Uncharacterized protein n=1 Tax=Actinoplanes hulinensis TaxID=1144547 RepID=A0ABS7AWM8_9ACTN|nr:hypothetical protein [Actinoplanes hulinensis]MBW6433087.1 hypothetical protein [Actinoplanes hulinensis]
MAIIALTCTLAAEQGSSTSIIFPEIPVRIEGVWGSNPHSSTLGKRLDFGPGVFGLSPEGDVVRFSAPFEWTERQAKPNRERLLEVARRCLREFGMTIERRPLRNPTVTWPRSSRCPEVALPLDFGRVVAVVLPGHPGWRSRPLRRSL